MADSKGYVPGDYNAYCDYCEGQYLASQLKKTWDGFMACPMDFTTRNPQDFVRPKTERIVPSWTRPTDGAGAYQVSPIILTSGSPTYTITPTDPTNNIYTFQLSGITTGTVIFDDPVNLPLSNLDYGFTITLLSPAIASSAGTPGLLTFTKAAGAFVVKGYGDSQGGTGGNLFEGHFIEWNVNKTRAEWWYTRRGQS